MEDLKEYFLTLYLEELSSLERGYSYTSRVQTMYNVLMNEYYVYYAGDSEGSEWYEQVIELLKNYYTKEEIYFLLKGKSDVGHTHVSTDITDLPETMHNAIRQEVEDYSIVQDPNYVHTDNNYTDAERSKLAGIESKAQVNIIETIKVNGAYQGVINKTVDLYMPTTLAELGDDAEHRVVTDKEKAIWNDKQDNLSEVLPDNLSTTNKLVAEVTTNAIEENIDRIEEKIPTEATKDNQLADKKYVDDNLDTEKTALEAAIKKVSDALTKEVGDRETAVSTEATARQTEDSALSDRIDAEKEARETKDTELSGLIASLNTSLNKEISDRKEGDETLTTSLNTEITNRTNADTALGKRIDAVTTNLENEASTRSSEDNKLSDRIDTEAKTRETKDTELEESITATTGNLTQEIANRKSGDEALTKALNTEISNRETAVNNEATTRDAADKLLQANIDAEEEARIAADNKEITARTEADTALGARIDTEISDRKTAISEEAKTRADADTALSDSLSVEVTARTDADTALGKRIDGVTTDLSAEVERATGVENGLNTRVTTIEGKISESASSTNKLTDKKYVDDLIKNNSDSLEAEVAARKAADTTLQTNINNETTRAKAAEETNAKAISDETTRAKAAEKTNADNIAAEEEARITADSTEKTAREEADTALGTRIDNEISAREEADFGLDARVTTIENKVSPAASETNKLADTDFVNSSIATATATFRGTFESLDALKAVEADKNDYAFWVHTDEAGNTCYDKYTFDSKEWKFEYRLNNSSFTSAQWAAINSEITKEKIAEIDSNISTLNTNLSTEVTTRTNDIATVKGLISDETTRAKEAESTLTTNLNTEIKAREDGDSALTTKIEAEEIRAKAAEKANADNIATEIEDRKSAVSTEEDARIAGDKANGESVTAEATARAAADTALEGKISEEATTRSDNDADLLAKINAEATTRDNADTVLTNNLNGEVSARQAADKTIKEQISSEITARKEADSALEDKITAEATARTDADSALSEKITQEVTDRKADTKNLTESIAAETTRAKGVESGIDTRVSTIEGYIPEDTSVTNPLVNKEDLTTTVNTELATEIAARKAADSTLTTDLSTEVTRAKKAEQDLIDSVDALESDLTKKITDSVAEEKTARETADTTINSAITKEISDRTTADSGLSDRIDAVETSVSNEAKARKDEDSSLLAKITAETTRATGAEETLTTSVNTINSKIPEEASTENLLADQAWVASKIKTASDSLSDRVTAIENVIPEDVDTTNKLASNSSVTTAVATEKGEREAADTALTTNLNKEIQDRSAADSGLDERITANANSISTEVTERKNDIKTINSKIPAAASASNQLADKAYVDNAFSGTGSFKGMFTDLEELKATVASKNDFAYYKYSDEFGNLSYDKYVYNDTEWTYEFTFNTSSFTTEQIAAINSGITADLLSTIQTDISNNTTNISNEVSNRETAVSELSDQLTQEIQDRTTGDSDLQTAISEEEAARKAADEALEKKIAAVGDLEAEITARKAADETLQSNIDSEASTRQTTDESLQSQITTEATRAKGAEEALTTDVNTIKSKISAAASADNKLVDAAAVTKEINAAVAVEKERATAAESVNATAISDEIKARQAAITAITDLIPSAAKKTENELADKAFVNSSISTSTATFRGTSASNLTEEEFLTWANGLTHDDNDYVYWNTKDEAGNTLYKRYKFSGNTWAYEYTLNNSSFTSDEWKAIQSGITDTLVAKLNGIATGAEVNVQSDWNVTETSSDAYIKNKPANVVQDASYVHTDNNYTTTEKNKLAGIANGAQVNSIEKITLNGKECTPDSNKNINLSVVLEESIKSISVNEKALSPDANKNVEISLSTATLSDGADLVHDSAYVHTDVCYTTAEQTKLAGITESAEPNTINSISVNNTKLTPDTSKNVNITVPSLTGYVNTLSTSGSGNGVSGITKDGSTLTVSKTTFLTEHQSLDGYVNTLTVTGTGNAITAAEKKDKTITLTKGATFLTSHQSLDGYVNAITNSGEGNIITSVTKSGKSLTFTSGYAATSVSVTGTGNAITTASLSAGVLTLTKGATFLTSHQSLDGYVNELTTSGSGNGVASVTKDGKKITVTKTTFLTSHQSLANYPTKTDLTNALADYATEDFVNSSIATSTATFRGTKEASSETEFLVWANALTTKDDNDYAFWVTTDSAGNTVYKRYKYDGTSWSYEYSLNNSSFTADQWSAINSGITSAKLTTINNNIATKQDKITTSNKLAYSLIDGTPTIPTVNNVTITFTQNGTTKGSFTLNQSTGATIALSDTNTTYSSKTAASGGTDLSLVTTGEKYTWNNNKGLATIQAGTGTNSECFNGLASSSASGRYSHAEGNYTAAEEDYSHAEGYGSTASGYTSHAEGGNTTAVGSYSHAEGCETIASGECSHAQGSYNESNTSAIDIVGIGTSPSARKNAEMTYTDGSKYIINVGGYDGTNASITNGAKTIQAVISDYESRIAALETALDGVLTQLQSI